MEDISVLSLLGRLVVSLAIVLALMAVLARVLRGRAMPGMGRSTLAPGTLRVLGRHSLSRASSVAVVAVADRAFLVGVTDGGVNLVAELDADTLGLDDPEAPTTAPAPTLRSWADSLRERTVRRS